MIRKAQWLVLACTFFASLLALGQTGSTLWRPVDGATKPKYADGELLVKFRPGKVSSSSTAHAQIGTQLLRSLPLVEGLQLVKVRSGMSVQAALQSYNANPDVEYAEPNYIVKVEGAPSDPLLSQQWALSNPGGAHATAGADIKAPDAWGITTGSSGVVVVVIDTGVDYTHPDLAANIFSNSADCNNNGFDDDGDGYVDDCHGINVVDHTSNPMDDFGHGTHVAGIIGAVGNNGVGVSGVNWTVQILPCKFLNSLGYGSLAGAIECLNYAKTLKSKGVNVVATNNSWGGLDFSAALTDAIAAQRDAGILFVAAAGNEFENNDTYPTFPATVQLANVISVASTTKQDRLSDFSNVGRRSVHLGAPGEDILSTLPTGGYGFASGTSMAAPYVTGTIALLKAQDPGRDWKQLKSLVLAGGDKVPELQSTITGRRLNAFGAMTCSSSDVYSRTAPQQSPVSIGVGTPITIAYMVFNCGTTAGQIQATVAETGETVTLKDDGVAPDEVANDGILTANWAPKSLGKYTVNVAGGDSFIVEALTPYVVIEKVSEYRTIAGTTLDLKDDAVASLTSPFPIKFGGIEFDKVYVSGNGTISFSTAFNEFYNRYLPLQKYPDLGWNRFQTTTLIAPWWDDLYPIPGTQENVFWDVTGAAPNREFVIEWRNVRMFDCHGDPDSAVRFEVVFKEGSNDVIFEYAKTAMSNCYSHDHGRSATIGLQTSGATGLTWSYLDTLAQDGTSLRFVLSTDPIPTNPVPTLTALLPNHAPAGANQDVHVVVQGTNFVPGSHVMWEGERRPTTYVSPTELHATFSWFDVSVTRMVQITVVNPEPGGGTSNALPFGVGGEPPSITSLTPSSVPAGSADFDLKISGTGFVTGQGFILFGPNTVNVTSATPTEIHAKIPAGYVANAGTYKVYAYGFAGFISNGADFVVTPKPTMQTFRDPFGKPATQVDRKPMRFVGWTTSEARRDEYVKWFSRDGARSQASLRPPDAPIAGGSLPPGTVLPGVLLNRAIPAGYIPTGIAVADFNRDGKLDWAVTNGGDSTIFIYLGHGDGTSEPAQIIQLRGVSPVSLVAADLRKNGITDLVVAEIDSGTVGVLLGIGDGTFEPELEHFVPAPPYSVKIGDFNGDGKLDIVAGSDSTATSGLLTYLPGLGTGEFGSPQFLPHPSIGLTSAYQLGVADLNLDSLSDVIVSDLAIGTVVHENAASVLKQGEILGYNEPAVGYYEYNNTTGDIDEDGCPDSVASTTFGLVAVRFGRCDGTFEYRQNLMEWGMGSTPFGIKLADVNGDGHLDIITGEINIGGGYGYGNNNGGLVSVSFGDGKGHFDYPRVYPAQQGIYELAVADINGDGKPDILTANQDFDSVSILLNDGQGGFGRAAGRYLGFIRNGGQGSVNDPLGSPLAFDVNGDNRPDLVFFMGERNAQSPYPIVTSLNLGNGRFSDPISSDAVAPGYLYPFDYAVSDFRKTGRQDLVILFNDLNGGGNYVFAANQGDGTFKTGAPHALVSTGASTGYGKLATGDFDGDGIPDVVNVGMVELTFLHSNGDGTFTAKSAGKLTNTGSANYPGSAWAVDLNHDGKLDVVVHETYNTVPYNDHAVITLLGNGDGTFGSQKVVIPNAGKVIVADVNHDGWIDVIDVSDMWSPTDLYSLVSPKIRVYLGQPDGTFLLSATYDQYRSGLSAPLAVDAMVSGRFDASYADYDGDGIRDLAVMQVTPTYPRANFVQFLKGQADGTFVPTMPKYRFGTGGSGLALTTADFDGDGKADMLEYDGYTVSFHILPGIAGRQLESTLLVNPVKGTNGVLRVVMGAPSTSDTSVSLSTSDPNIQIASAATIPAGAASVDVPFTIGASFNMNRQFVINSQLGTETTSAYGTQVPVNAALGFALSPYMNNLTALPAGSTGKMILSLYTKAGYGGLVTLSCGNLPSGGECVFDLDQVELPRGAVLGTNFRVDVPPNVAPGDYTFDVRATDGVSVATAAMTLTVADFSVTPPGRAVELLPGGNGAIPIAIQSPANVTNSVRFTCSVANGGGTCSVAPTYPVGYSISLHANEGTLGTYPVNLTASSGTLSHSVTASLHVVNVTPKFSATTLNMTPGAQKSFDVQLDTPDGLINESALVCETPVLSCSNYVFVRFPTGAKSVIVTLQVMVPANYSVASGAAQASATNRAGVLMMHLALCSFLPLGLLICSSGRRSVRVSGCLLLLVIVCGVFISCGGGGSGGSSINNPPPPPPPPPPVVKSETLTIRLVHPDFTKTLGTVTVSITK